jgi:hypothetical protein
MTESLSALRAGSPLPQEDSWCSYMLEAESIRGLSAAGKINELKNLVT